MVNLPNLLTISRILLVPVFVYCMLEGNFIGALIIFSLGCITDGLDGYLARKYNQITQYGKFLDPLADKFFLLCSFTASYVIDILPLWVLIIVFIKEIIIVSGLIALSFSVKKIDFKPTMLGKTTTVVEMVTIALILLNGIGLGHIILLYLSFMTTFVVILISTVSYVFVGMKAYKEARELE